MHFLYYYLLLNSLYMSFRAILPIWEAATIISAIVNDKLDIYYGEAEHKYSIFVFLESVDHTDC